ncbi:lactate dehydrogenase [Methyloceanibacter methanicus]|uniref:D-lactate dehydrogenase (cytochrome) n=1 Tax=Methyloceanibacter methanicus TaxID=1774968 RepID=A0A1E3VX70_9HYPH|nr:FAD-linked oxidase C-terminal domain-containing protein [Methyloceanibacter methanicus]ODR98120.1 lactate dehydrogenase [Methyloceanibacter methanicus]
MTTLVTLEPHRNPASPADKDALFARLSARFGKRFSRSEALRAQHANTLTWLKVQAPDAVLFAQSTEEVSEAVAACAAARVPVIPYGAGSSLEGQLNAPFGGLSLDLSEMKEIVSVHEDDLDCVVQAGVTRKQLNDYLRDTGLFFPVDPGADASLGGMAATRASGTNAVCYGTMRDAVLGLTAVLADGRIVKTGAGAKSAAGYDLTRLLVGSEGTLGVITELTLKLFGIPETILAGVSTYRTLEGACNATIAALQMGLPLARIELLDEVQVRACNAYSKLSVPEQPTLFLEFHGTPTGAREQVEIFSEIAQAEGGGALDWAARPEDRNRLWRARHDAYWAAKNLRPGTDLIATDVCVPISALAACVIETKQDIDRLGLVAPIVGHVGDGNFHVMPLIDSDSTDELERARAFLDRLIERALRFEGTCTGEHGVGQGKIGYLVAEHGQAVDVMIAIKKALDPSNILNPGKIFALDV